LDTKSKTQKIEPQSLKQKWLRKSKKLDPEYIKENPTFGIQIYPKAHRETYFCALSAPYSFKRRNFRSLMTLIPVSKISCSVRSFTMNPKNVFSACQTQHLSKHCLYGLTNKHTEAWL
jgi:hypothetical protein